MLLSKYVIEGRSGTKISVLDLPSKSNKNVSCKCDDCGKKYIQRFSRNKDTCYGCRKPKSMAGNSFGTKTKGIPRPNYSGSNHPRWNPNKSEFRTYANQVRWLSEKEYVIHKVSINPNDLPRTLCGIDGGYQLDHKLSIKKAFELKLPIEIVAKVENLQLLPWKDNRSKAA